MRTRWLCIFFLVLMTVLSVGSARATVTITQPYPGVTHIYRDETITVNDYPSGSRSQLVKMHIFEIDLTTPGIKFLATPDSPQAQALNPYTYNSNTYTLMTQREP